MNTFCDLQHREFASAKVREMGQFTLPLLYKASQLSYRLAQENHKDGKRISWEG